MNTRNGSTHGPVALRHAYTPFVLPEPPSVFEYIDYRAFMRDHYTAQKARNTNWSFRFLARQRRLHIRTGIPSRASKALAWPTVNSP